MALRPDNSLSREEQLAARNAAEQGVLMREVDDALRQSEMQGAVKRFGIPAAIGAVVLLVGLGGYLWWDGSQKSGASKRGEEFTMALDKVEHRQLAVGDKELAVLSDGSAAGTRAAATMMRGGIALEQGKPDDAAKFFARVSADNAAPQPYRDLATIREVAVKFDTMTPQQVIDKLKPLAVPGNPWLGSAGELLGMAYLKQGRNDLAGPLFKTIAQDKGTPESLRARSRQMAGLLGQDAISDSDVEKAASGGMLGQ